MKLLNGKPYTRYDLPNGLQVCYQQTDSLRISGRLRVFHGSLNERPDEYGVAHLLEHLLFRGGTERYNTSDMDRFIAKIGKGWGATVYDDQTHITATTLCRNLDRFLEMASQVAFSPRIDQERLDKEREPIIREMAITYGRRSYWDVVRFKKALLGDGPFINEALGDPEVVRAATREQLLAFHARGFHANNAELHLVGGLPEDIEERIAYHFSDAPIGDGKRFIFPEAKKLDRAEFFHRPAPDLATNGNATNESASIWLGVPAVHTLDPDAPAVNTLTNLLDGERFYSRLIESLRHENGLVYGLNVTHHSINGPHLVFSFTVKPEMIERGVEILFDEFARIQNEPPTEDEMEEIMFDSLLDVVTCAESLKARCTDIQNLIDYDRDSDKTFALLQSVTPEDVSAVARRYLPASRDDPYVLMVRDPALVETRKAALRDSD